ncbi:putative metal ion transporter [Pseudomonas saudimassiliensis]|uniref:Polyamine export protein n=1 Tax=Pseudomonas saudimassiliensis TaxID=1461581 RepID=A0A078MED4_9PSED|nr:hemolysin family protein [Pseudomonas saudimassiliensis]CEA04609.1 putative metal ion transporter [Pseudomonas saudimassiliensis]CEF26710.1 putative metal ion transporter [Pseudomonas saudimassiliensis]
MSFSQSLLLLALIIVGGAFLAIAEISLAAARPLKLRRMADNGNARALKVIAVQQNPGNYLTVVQISINALAILGGIVGEEFLTAAFTQLLLLVLEPPLATALGFTLSFVVLTSLFIVVTDLIPKQVAMALPEPLAVFSIGPMRALNMLLRPLVWFYSRLVSGLIKLLHLPARRDDEVTPEDILALTEAGARSGLLAPGEQQAIENIFELDTRTLPSAMSNRDEIVYFLLDDSDALIRSRIADTPHSCYPVCDGDIDHIVGYVSMKDLFKRVLHNEPISLQDPGLLHKPLVVPDRLTLAELLKQFRLVGEDFALIVNEYSLVVGLITVNDVMSIVMGDLVPPWYEEQIVRRDDNSWLIDGITPIQDVRRALEIEDIPQEEGYETLAGFMMAMLRRVPRRTDRVIWGEYTFEVVDVDSYRIDQVLATRTGPVVDTGPE